MSPDRIKIDTMHNLLIFIGFIFICNGCNPIQQNKQADGFRIIGTMQSNRSSMVYLERPENDAANGKLQVIDSAIIKNKSFEFNGYLDFPAIYKLRFNNQRGALSFLIENESIDIKVNETNLRKSSIAGSRLQTILSKHHQQVETIFMDLPRISKERIQAVKEDNQKEINRLDSIRTALYHEQRSFTIKTIAENTDNLVGVYLASKTYYTIGHQEELEIVMNWFDAGLQGHSYYRHLAGMLKEWEQLSFGALAPNFTMNDTSGTGIEMHDLKGKYLLVDFWASWCKPCREENPELLKVYNEFKPAGFEILGVSLDDKRLQWIKAIDHDGIQWIHVSDLKGWQSEIVNTYQLDDLPVTYLLDPEGKIIGKNLKRDRLKEVLEKLM